MFQPSPVVAEIYQSPSSEALRLLRRAPWLASPEGGHSRIWGRISLSVIIAPMTQLTFFNFDLQAFLFLVFHTSTFAVVGHALFMTSEHLFIMAALRHIHLAGTPLDAALLYVVSMLAWYGTVAFRARLLGWFALTIPLVAALYFASEPIAVLSRTRLHVAPAWGILASAFLIALSHASEPLLPPRTVDPWRWRPLRDYLTAPGIGAGTRVLRLLNLASILVSRNGSRGVGRAPPHALQLAHADDAPRLRATTSRRVARLGRPGVGNGPAGTRLRRHGRRNFFGGACRLVRGRVPETRKRSR